MAKKTTLFAPMKVLWKQYSIVIFVSALKGLIAFAYVFIIQRMAHAIEISSISLFRRRSIVLLSVIILSFCCNLFLNYYTNIMARDASIYLDTKYLKHFLQLDNNVVEKYGTGKMASIFHRGLIAWITLLWKISANRTKVTITILAALVYLGMQGRRFLVIGIVLMIVGAIWIRSFHGKGKVYRREQKEVQGEIDRLLVRWIMSKFEILQLGKYTQEAERDAKLNTQWAGYRIKETFWTSLCYDGVATIIQVIVALMVVYIGYNTIQGVYAISDYVLFAGLITLFGGVVAQFSEMGKEYFDNRVHINKFLEVMGDETTQSQTVFEGDAFTFSQGGITFEEVSYDYGSGNIIDNLSLHIHGGKKTALVGPSGGGKTTLTKLISGYLQPTQGKILVDGQNLSKINISSYYRHLGYLTQDPLIFDGTVRENLIYASAGIPTEEQMREALLRAKCEFVFDLKDGFDTEIGERGIRLSGGQRQRLAIAKLFLKDPEIIILDEPTSALDSISEQAVTEAFQNLFAGRTVIIIAHRLQTVKQADEILMIENGKVVERGTHHTLSIAGGTYQRMLELQSGFVG